MTQTHDGTTGENIATSVPDRLVRNFLKQAHAALNTNDLQEARNLFQKALEVEGANTDRENEIRQELKRYSERVTKQEPPDWELAYQGLDLLSALGLQSGETDTWRRDLKLEQAKYLLERKQQNESFDIFGALIAEHEQSSDRDEILARISSILRENISRRAANHEWDSLRKMIGSIKELWPQGDGLHQWLETISEALKEAFEEAPAKYEAEIEQLKRKLEGMHQAKQSRQNMLYAVSGIFVIFYFVLLYLWAF